jgi:hypothetical protein
LPDQARPCLQEFMRDICRPEGEGPVERSEFALLALIRASEVGMDRSFALG